MGRRSTSVLAACATLALPALAAAGSITPTRGELHGLTDRGPVPLPVIKTRVIGHISGALANVKVRQTFHNPNAKPLEAIYVFPLPDDASIHGITVTTGERVVRGVVRPRAEARELYEKARRAGKLSALLEQERPNIFTQTVANILPGSKVVVDVEYDVQLRYRDGYYSFAYPMVVGSRYIPGDFDGKVPVGFGTHPDTDQVPDASRITPPVRRSGRTIDLAITIDPGSMTREVFSPTHKIAASAAPQAGEHALRVALARADEIPNKDFVVRYRLAGDKPAVSAVSHSDRRGGFFSFRFEPPSQPPPSDIAPRELVFVVDTSGSHAGAPLALVKRGVTRALRELRPGDTFQVISFAGGPRRLFPGPRPHSEQNIARALRFVDAIEAEGKTELVAAVRAALATPAGRDRLRVVCFATDGFVGNDRDVLAEVSRRLDPDTRLFPIGVGSSPNRFLLERMAELGRGSVIYLLPDDKPEEQVDAMLRRIRAPVLTHVSIDWKGLAVRSLEPRILPDVFAGEPVELVGMYSRPQSATVDVRGRIGGREVVFKVPVELTGESANPAIARQWARAQIRRLVLDEIGGTSREQPITQLAMRFSLMTAYTALVAVVGDVAVAPGDLRTVMLAVERPDGMDRDGDGIADREDEDFHDEGDDLDDDKPRDEPVERDVRVGETAGKAVDAGSVLPAPDSGEALTEEIAVTRLAGVSVAGRGARLTLGVGFGASLGGDNAVAGAVNLGYDALVGRLALGAGLNLQLRGAEDENLAGAALLQLSVLDVLAGLGPLRLELTAGAGVSATADNLGLGLAGALKLIPRRLPLGLQLRYDGALRFDAADLSTFTAGLELSF